MKVINNRYFGEIKINNMKLIFHLANIILIILYLFPGSLLGCFLYKNCQIQPQLTPDFIVSSNHVFAFTLISILGLLSYSKKKISKKMIFYLFFMSFFLELTHLMNPSRGFEIGDLAGNIVGVLFSYLIYLLLKLKKNK